MPMEIEISHSRELPNLFFFFSAQLNDANGEKQECLVFIP